MIRNLKALGLAAFALLAMGALFASGAQAQKGIFTAGLTPETHTHSEIKGEQYGQENYFEVGENKAQCELSTFSGTDADGTATSLSVQAHYTDCSSNGLPATVTMNGCEYEFNQPERIAETETTWTSTVDLVCPEGKSVIIESYLFGGVTSHSFKVCTLTLEPVENLGHVVYHAGEAEATKEVKRDDLTVTMELSGTPIVEDNQACSAGEQEIPNTVEGSYVSNVTMWAEKEEVEPCVEARHHDLWISEE